MTDIDKMNVTQAHLLPSLTREVVRRATFIYDELRQLATGFEQENLTSDDAVMAFGVLKRAGEAIEQLKEFVALDVITINQERVEEIASLVRDGRISELHAREQEWVHKTLGSAQ